MHLPRVSRFIPHVVVAVGSLVACASHDDGAPAFARDEQPPSQATSTDDAASPDAAASADTIVMPEQTVDVVVYGAGAGGVAAAIEAARLGRTVALVEPTAHVGGQLITETSMDEVGSPAVETVPGNTLDGLYGDFMARVANHYAAMSPPRSIHTCYFSDGMRAFEAHVGESILRAMIAEQSNITLVTSAEVTSVLKDAQGAVSGVIANGRAYRARVTIDASEYGDLLPLAGAAYRVGNGKWDPSIGANPPPAACTQNMTYPVTIRAYTDWNAMPPGLDLRNVGPLGDDEAATRAVFASIVTPTGGHGVVPVPWDFATHNAYRGVPDSEGASYLGTEPDKITKTMVNAANDYPANAYPYVGAIGVPVSAIENRDERRALECRARLRTLQFIHYMQTARAEGGLGETWSIADENGAYGAAPDCDTTIVPTPVQAAARLFPALPYVRESRRVIGVETVAGKDILRTGPALMPGFPASATRAYATSMLVEYHLPDLHGCNTDATLETAELGDTAAQISGTQAGPFQVPFGSFVPRDVEGLLVAEKNLSMSRIVSSDVRLHPPSMTSGQVAGVIAALAVARDERPRDVPPVLVQRRLVEQKSTISMWGFTDVPRTHRFWPDVQLVSTHGIMRGIGGFQFAVDAPLTRAQAAIVLARALRYHVVSPPDWTPLQNFADVPSSDPAFAHVEALAREGITSGCGKNGQGQPIYCPTANVTRAQLAVMLVRALELATPACGGSAFDDIPAAHPSCSDLRAARDASLVFGCTATQFCPDAVLTRGEAASFIARALDYVASHATTRGACHRKAPAYCGDDL